MPSLVQRNKVRNKGMLTDKTRVMLDMGLATIGNKPGVPLFKEQSNEAPTKESSTLHSTKTLRNDVDAFGKKKKQSYVPSSSMMNLVRTGDNSNNAVKQSKPISLAGCLLKRNKAKTTPKK